jgi:hypothetical protein
VVVKTSLPQAFAAFLFKVKRCDLFEGLCETQQVTFVIAPFDEEVCVVGHDTKGVDIEIIDVGNVAKGSD